MTDRSPDWFVQAGRNLAQAKDSAQAERHEWACFAAQQAAEAAVKALHLRVGQDAWGHVVRRLLEDLSPHIVVPSDIIEAARVLDTFYVPTRYPNGHAEGAPGERDGPQQSSAAIYHAGQILEFVRAQMANP